MFRNPVPLRPALTDRYARGGPVCRSRRKMSAQPLVSPLTRLMASIGRPRNVRRWRWTNRSNYVPLRPVAGQRDAHGGAGLPVADEDVGDALVSPLTRLLAAEENVTKRPSAEIAGDCESALAWSRPSPPRRAPSSPPARRGGRCPPRRWRPR